MSLKHAILGFLADRPMTGYDLRKAFESSVGHFWSADQAQIYRTLSALVSERLVEADLAPQAARPDRKPHRITAAGEDALLAWLAAPARLAAEREPFLLQVFHAARLGQAGALRLLAERTVQAQSLLEALDAVAAVMPASGELAHFLRRATLENGRAHARAERRWARQTRAALLEMPNVH